MRRPLVRTLATICVTLCPAVILSAQNTTHLGARAGGVAQSRRE